MKKMYDSYKRDLLEAIEAHGYNAQPKIIDNTFVSDFRIAECFGEKAIKDTFDIVVKEWQNDVRYYAAFVYALSALCWYHYDKGNKDLSALYGDLYHKAQLLTDTFKWNDLEKKYYFCVTD